MTNNLEISVAEFHDEKVLEDALQQSVQIAVVANAQYIGESCRLIQSQLFSFWR